MIRPSIDAFSAKNAELSTEQSSAILAAAGLVAGQETSYPTFTRSDGTPGSITRRAEVLEEGGWSPGSRS